MTKNFDIRVIVLPCMLAISSCLTVAAHASTSSQGFGRVNMQGSIINTPCAIATEDLDQSVDMKVTTVGEVIDNGQGQAYPFSVNLVNCDLSDSTSDATHFRTTFDGSADEGLFTVNGASGVGLQIADAEGHIATPGQPLAEGQLVTGTQRLNYTLRLVRNHSPFKTGNYSAILRFKVDYF